MPFRDRQDAGQQLARLLAHYRAGAPIVLALPRGGVPVGEQVAMALDAPLDVLVVRKIGAPFHRELGIGAIAEGGVVYLSDRARELGIGDDEIEEIRAREATELARRIARFRGTRPLPDVRARTVILVDDGIATGGTVKAAIQALRALGVGRLVLATPVAAAETVEELAREVDDLVCVQVPDDLWAIGFWYLDFRQLSDEEVVASLERAGARHPEGEREQPTP